MITFIRLKKNNKKTTQQQQQHSSYCTIWDKSKHRATLKCTGVEVSLLETKYTTMKVHGKKYTKRHALQQFQFFAKGSVPDSLVTTWQPAVSEQDKLS